MKGFDLKLVELNEIYKFNIIDVDNNGNGIAKYNNFVIFIKGCFEGEVVEAKVIKISKRFAVAKILKIIEKSSKRRKIFCPYYYECGGCNFLHMGSLDEKVKKEKELTKLFPNYNVTKLLSLNKLFYRNKVSLHVKDKKLGFFSEETSDLVEIDKCLLLNENINETIKYLKNKMVENVDEVVIRYSIYQDKIMIILKGNIDEKYLNIFEIPKLSSVYINEKKVFGYDYLIEQVDDKKYAIYPDSFFQVNSEMIKVLYDTVKENISNDDTLLDLYCGAGTIGIYLNDKFRSIYGIDNNKDAIKGANLNKKLNNVYNINFSLDDASNFKKNNISFCIVDPPRSGLSKKTIDKLLSLNSKSIIYVSCNPKTLKDNLKLLEEKYEVKKIIPVNMFYRTKHVESVCILKKLGGF